MPGIIALAACCFEICGDRDEGGDCAFVSHPKIRIGAIPIVHKLLSETLTLGRMLMILGMPPGKGKMGCRTVGSRIE